MTELYRPFQPLLTNSGLHCFGLAMQHYPVCKSLKGIVHSYLQMNTAKPTPYPVIPDGTQAIYISPYGIKIGGALSKALDLELLQSGEYFGVRFYPGALRHFFNLDLSEITDQFVDSQYFPCQGFAKLHNDIYQSQSFQQRAQLCEQWLLRQFAPLPASQFDQMLSLIYQSSGNIKINQLAGLIGLTSRHLNRLFRQYTGLSTKAFTQIIRIQHACKQLYLKPGESLETAFDLGFYDQAHLLKDYKSRLSSNPSLFFERFRSDFYNR